MGYFEFCRLAVLIIDGVPSGLVILLDEGEGDIHLLPVRLAAYPPAGGLLVANVPGHLSVEDTGDVVHSPRTPPTLRRRVPGVATIAAEAGEAAEVEEEGCQHGQDQTRQAAGRHSRHAGTGLMATSSPSTSVRKLGVKTWVVT